MEVSQQHRYPSHHPGHHSIETHGAFGGARKVRAVCLLTCGHH